MWSTPFEHVFAEVFSDTVLAGRDDLMERFVTLGRMLVRANEELNLTRITSPRELAIRHFLEAFVLERSVDLAPGPVMDLGTGAGFPGLPLAMLRPDLEFTLVDSRAKKIAFVRNAIGRLELTNVRALEVRGEDHLAGHVHGALVARAVAPVGRLARLLAPVRERLDRLVLMKGPGFAHEWQRDRQAVIKAGFRLEGTYRRELPAFDEAPAGPRTLVVAILRGASTGRSE